MTQNYDLLLEEWKPLSNSLGAWSNMCNPKRNITLRITSITTPFIPMWDKLWWNKMTFRISLRSMEEPQNFVPVFSRRNNTQHISCFYHKVKGKVVSVLN
jgi:hypothetical protein